MDKTLYWFVDTETESVANTGPDPRGAAKTVMVGISSVPSTIDEEPCYTVAVDTRPSFNKTCVLVGHNVVFDYLHLKKAGYDLSGVVGLWDTQHVDYLLSNHQRMWQRLDQTCDNFGIAYDVKNDAVTDIFAAGKGADEAIRMLGAVCVRNYLREDVLKVMQIWEAQRKALGDKAKLVQHSLEYMLAVADMTWTGMPVDGALLTRLMHTLDRRVESTKKSLTAWLRDYVLHKVRIEADVPHLVRHVDIEKLPYLTPGGEISKTMWGVLSGHVATVRQKLPSLAANGSPLLTKAGKPKADRLQHVALVPTETFLTAPEDLKEETLREFDELTPVSLMLEIRKLTKLKNTFVRGVLEWSHDGLLRCKYNMSHSATGRPTSSNPNAQNFPVRDGSDDVMAFRRCFVSNVEDYVEVDFSGLEVWITGLRARDRTLLRELVSGKDMHRATAAEWKGIPPADVSDSVRKAAKGLRFMLQYGGGAPNMAKRFKISEPAARGFINTYWNKYQGHKAWVDWTMTNAELKPMTQTYVLPSKGWTGREWEVKVSKFNGGPDRNAAMNYPIQGTATGDVLLTACIAAATYASVCPEIKPCAMIHDSIIYRVPKELSNEAVVQHVAAIMGMVPMILKERFGVEIPRLPYEIARGASWGDCKNIHEASVGSLPKSLQHIVSEE